MNWSTSKTNEETNFIKCSLLLTTALHEGLQSLLIPIKVNKEERNQNEFQKLCHFLRTENAQNTKLQNGLATLSELRERFFADLSKHQSVSDHDFEAIISQLLKVFKELGLPLNYIHEICSRNVFSEDEVVLAHEKLSQEKRIFKYLGPECYHKTVQRQNEVDVIVKQFYELNQRNPKGNSTVFIDGERGVGKSVLARQVAEACWKSDGDDKPEVVMVVNAATEDTLLLSYIKFAKELLCNFTQVENAITSPGLMIEERLRLLKHIIGTQLKKYSHWLVVIDNVNHYDSFSSYWPLPGNEDWGRGHIIVTLLDVSDVDKSFFFFASGHARLANGMAPSEAVHLLREASEIKADDSTMNVAELLQYHPLGLACAAVFAKFFIRTESPWQRYIELFNNNKKDRPETKGEMLDSYSDSCIKAAHMLLTQLQDENGAHLMSIGQLPYLSIKKEALVSHFNDLTRENVEQYLSQFSPFLSVERINRDKTDSISLRYQLINRTCPGFKVNRASSLISALSLLAHELSVLENSQSVLIENVCSVSNAASHLASEITKLTDQEKKHFIEQLIQHTAAGTDAVNMLLALAQQCRLTQKLEQSKVLLTVAKDVLETESSLKSWNIGEVLYCLGMTMRDTGDSSAKEHLERALDIFIEQGEPSEDKPMTELLTALGDVALTSEDMTQAKVLYKKALKACSKQPSNIATAFCHFKLGNVFALEKSFKLAKEHYEKALNLVGDTNLVILSKVLTCAGAISVCVEDYQLAQGYLEKAMTIETRLYSKFHPCRQNAIKNAANAFKALEDNESAERLLKESLEISHNITCRWNAEEARVFSQLGSLKSVRGDLKEAIECYTNALQIHSDAVHCHVHPSIADSCFDLADVYARNGELDYARSLHERALGIRGLIFKPDHPDLGTSYFHLGKVYSTLDDYQTAQSLLERSVEIRGKIFGSDHPDTLNSMYYLGNSHARLGDFHNAKNLYETVAKEQEKLVECTAVDLAKTTESLAETNLSLGDVNKAKEQFKRAISLQRSETQEDNTEVARPLVRLALLHEHCNEIREAKTLLEKALDIYRKSVCGSGRSRAVITEAHLMRVVSKLTYKSCVVM